MTTEVYVLFKMEMLMPYLVPMVVSVHATEEAAEAKRKELEELNDNPLESDSYGPLSGCYYEVREYEVQ